MVAICGFLNWGGGTDISFQLTSEPAEGLSDWFFYIAGRISICMWMYSGYESMSTIAGEVSNPQVIPKGTFITIPLIMAVYILPTTAGLGSMGRWSEWGADAGTVGYADVVTTFWGPAFGMLRLWRFWRSVRFITHISRLAPGAFSLWQTTTCPRRCW